MNEQNEERNVTDDALLASYKVAVERALPRIPVKNGVVDIDSIWVETSIPFDILESILRREDLTLPPNVERIHLKSRASQGEPSGTPRGRKRREVRN
ncbi:MAG: hypothetical protein PHV11_00670 [Candidatus Bipolaricaulis sp.]|nr:hypothetical protein [Candidatus Bipolaricaulis sp.]MDD5219067.1 hypothetical protein [Candidatus Bipolaricaulis sp.]MDD5645831.1 hypothetical protein [Candidatus Bipolaricaulis sp.]